jgi:hypothetical protein
MGRPADGAEPPGIDPPDMNDTGRDFWADEYWGSDRATFEDELSAFRDRTAAAEVGHRIRPIRPARRAARVPRRPEVRPGDRSARTPIRSGRVRRTVRVGPAY